jgi:hypothetical protein
MAAIEYRGAAAVTNFDLTCYSQLPSAKPGQPKFAFQEVHDGSPVNSDGGSCVDYNQETMLEEISRQAMVSRDSSCDDLQMLRALAGDNNNIAAARCIPDGGSCTDLQFLETISQEFEPKATTTATTTFSKMRYTRDGGSSNDLQKLERMNLEAAANPTFWDDDAPILCDDNTEELIQDILSKIPSVDMYQMVEPQDHKATPDAADGFTLQELSEMATTGSASSDGTSLVAPKEESYDFSGFEEFSFDDSCQSSELLENDSSFWNHMLRSAEQSTFPSMEELPAIKWSS